MKGIEQNSRAKLEYQCKELVALIEYYHLWLIFLCCYDILAHFYYLSVYHVLQRCHIQSPRRAGSVANSTQFSTNTHSLSICFFSFSFSSSVFFAMTHPSTDTFYTPLAVTVTNEGVRFHFIFFSEVASFSSVNTELGVSSLCSEDKRKEDTHFFREKHILSVNYASESI